MLGLEWRTFLGDGFRLISTMHDRHVRLNEQRLLSKSVLTAVRYLSMVVYGGNMELTYILGNMNGQASLLLF